MASSPAPTPEYSIFFSTPTQFGQLRPRTRFSGEDTSLLDYQRSVARLSAAEAQGDPIAVGKRTAISLYVGWVSGEERY